VILDFQNTMRFVSSGRIQWTQRTVYLLLNETGVSKLPKISQMWPAWRSEKPTIRVRVITKDGNVHLLDPNTITESGIPTQVADLYSDVKILSAPLPAIAPGAVVEAEIECNDRETVNPGGQLQQLSLFGDVPVQFFKLTLELPAGSPFHLGDRHMPKLERKETTADQIHRVELTATDIPIFKPMAMAPPDATGSPALIFSDVAGWQQVAKWYSAVLEHQIAVAQPASTDAAARMSEIEAILADIQKQVRYTGVELGYAAFEPRAPAETMTRGYGDCKDKAALLVSRLRKAGIAATLALLTPYPSPDVAPDVPGMEAFAHAIAYVPGKRPLWIDPTAEYAPARRLPLADQGRLALIVDPQTTELTRTPESKPSDNRSLNEFTLTLTEDGKSRLETAHEEAGGFEDYSRPMALTASQAPENRRDAMMTAMEKGIPGKVKNIDWGAPKDLDKPARIVVRSEDVPDTGQSGQAVYTVIKGIGEQAQLTSLLGVLRSEKDEPEAKDRKEDYWFPGPFVSEDRYRVVPPPGFRLKQLPKVSDLPYGPVTVQRKVSLEADGSVLFAYRVEGGRRFTPKEAQSLRDAAEKTRIDPFRVEFLSEGALLMSDGKWKDGFERLRREAEAPSATAPALLRYAAGLLEAGFRDQAVAACRKAIELDPKSAAAYARLSFLYRHDPAGRLDIGSRDLAESEKAIRKAIELDPSDKHLVLDLATILEWKNPEERYADKAALQGSIKLLEEISKDLPDLQATNQLPIDLFYLRRFSDMHAFYERPEGGRSRGDVRIAGVAAADSAADALREAERLFPSETSRQSVVTGAGQFLIAIGEYSKAADLLHDGTNGSSIPQADLDLLRKTRHGSDIQFSTNGAVAAVQHYVLALFDPTSGLHFSDWLVPEWRSLTFLAQRNSLLATLTPFRRVGNVQLGTRATADLVVSSVEFVPEGSDAVGYRVRFADPSRNGARKTVAWVVKRGDTYQLLGLAGDQSTAAGEALALAQKGDLAGARRWLNWEREEIAVPSSADPLAAEAFFKLWPLRAGIPERDQTIAAAASLVARGHYYRQGADALSAIHAAAQDPAFQSDIDVAWADGLSRNTEYAEAAPIWRRVQQQYPDSEIAFNALGLALVRSGHLDEALMLTASVNPDDDLYAAAQQARARVFQVQHKYLEAVKTYQAACKSAKATAFDWNNEAWLTLFLPADVKPDGDAANKANQLTQGRNSAYVHTLAAIQAETGQLKEARQSLVRYLGFFDVSTPINGSAQYLMGRIAEGLGMRETAEKFYSALTPPKINMGDDAYDLAQIRLKIMPSATAR